MYLGEVLLEEIIYNRNDDPFIPWADEDHARSVAGAMFDPLLVMESAEGLKLIAIHRLYRAARAAGVERVSFISIENPAADYLRGYYLRLLPEGQIAPRSRLRIIDILAAHGSADSGLDCRYFGVPAPFSDDAVRRSFLESLSEPVAEFLVQKKIAFKILKLLGEFPPEYAYIPEDAVKAYNMSSSRFREILELAHALIRRDGNPGMYAECHTADELYQAMYRVRYPEYSQRMNAFETIKARLPEGVQVNMPAFFEGAAVGICINARRKDMGREAIRSLEQLSPEIIRSLLELL
jgi:hypothetical protein